tara:strand:- start:9971 stop:12472 length:2502 start_codon:yes stop_codon:yes gene_type:complete
MAEAASTTRSERSSTSKPRVLLTGAAGAIGSALIRELRDDYTVVGFDLPGNDAACELYEVDLTSQDSIALALEKMRQTHGDNIASVIHLAAYFDFTGEENPLYEKVNVEGTRNLLDALQKFQVGQFVYSGTMLVHRPGAPGEPINESRPIEPKWAYPQSKAKTEDVIHEHSGDIPYVLLHLAGLYDDKTAVPTLIEQIKRIYERDPHAHAYADSLETGQSFIHKDDMTDAVRRSIDRRDSLPENVTILVGEPDAMSYGELQDKIAEQIHGTKDWMTVTLPKPLAKIGAWVEEKAEPVIPDAFDQGEEPFIKPFMIEMADDHYELDISRARDLLGWTPRHSISDELSDIVDSLLDDPLAWYERNDLTPPQWLTEADKTSESAETLRSRAETEYVTAHGKNLWAHWLNMALGLWLITAPSIMVYHSASLIWSDMIAGGLILGGSFLALDWRLGLARWGVAAVAVWVMSAPLFFWAPTASVYLNDTLVGALVFGLAVLTRPAPGISIVARASGPTVPKGWEYSPSSWFQRIPIIALAMIGFLISRHMTAYQLGHIDGMWDPFFMGEPGNDKNGSEEITTSKVSEAWPVPDAGIGALTYMLEILTGVIGSSRRWRTMPWLVILFGIMIVPLGVVSITFIVIQPIVIGTWCTLCLIAAAAMLIQIPYSVDELIATSQFLARRKKAGRSLLRSFLMGDTDEGKDERVEDDFSQPPLTILKDMLGGGVNVPWSLAACMVLGTWLMFTRLTLGAEGAMANANHFLGAMVLTVAVTALAEAMRPVRFLITLLGLAVAIMPFILGVGLIQTGTGLIVGLALIALSIPRGSVKSKYGSWSKHIF